MDSSKTDIWEAVRDPYRDSPHRMRPLFGWVLLAEGVCVARGYSSRSSELPNRWEEILERFQDPSNPFKEKST